MSDNESKYVTNTYDNIAKHFSKTRRIKWDWITNFIKSLPPNSHILDIGCGNGRNMQYENYNFTGVDSSIEFLKICQEKNLNVVKADMCNLPFGNNSFDAIIAIASFHHLSNNKRRIKSLNEMERVLKSNGKILISNWSINQPISTKRKFNFGDNFVEWNKQGEIFTRYYYIFRQREFENYFNDLKLKISTYEWNYGNDIYTILYK